MAQRVLTFEEVGRRRAGEHAGGRRQKYVLDEPGRRLILARYDSQSATITELARHLRVPRYTVRHWANQLGVARTKEARWSPEEVTYLEASLGHVGIKRIAAHLGRTLTAVKLKAKRLDLRKSGTGYTMRALCAALGVDHHKVERWMRDGCLKGTHRQTERLPQQGGDMWLFTPREIRQFLVAYPGEVDPRRFEWLWVVAILSGQG